MIEMSALANATGMPLSKRGMIGPAASVKTLQNVFSPKEFGGVLEEEGVIDYCTGDVAPGVFVIVKSTKPYIAHEMSKATSARFFFCEKQNLMVKIFLCDDC